MKIKNLLSSRAKWTTGADARTVKGKSCSLDDPKAVRWCLYSALYKCYPIGHRDKIAILIRKNIDSHTIIGYNDTHTYKDVRALVNKLDI